VDTSEIVRNIALSIAAVIGIILLAWRSFSLERSSRAAIRQARIASEQLNISSKQIEIASENTKAYAQQSINAQKQLEQNERKQSVETYVSAIEILKDSSSDASRVGALTALSVLSQKDSYFWQASLEVFIAFMHENNALDEGISFSPYAKQAPRYHEKKKIVYDQPYWLFGLEQQEIVDAEQVTADLKFSETDTDEVVNRFYETVRDAIERIPSWTRSADQKINLSCSVQQAIREISTLNMLYNRPTQRYISLRNLDLKGYEFNGLMYRNSSFINTDMRWAGLVGASFTDCTFMKVDLSGTIAKNANFSDSTFILCDFQGANLDDAQFDGVEFTMCNLRRSANLNNDQFHNVRHDVYTTFPDGININKA
jgi:uncharacterized protein YjbI with pentapeptide repeats